MIPYSISPQAKNDLDEIWSYIAHDSYEAADRMIALFFRKFLLLSTQPLIGEKRDEFLSSLRSFTTGNYAIFYRPTENKITIIRVIHAARDIDSQF